MDHQNRPYSCSCGAREQHWTILNSMAAPGIESKVIAQAAGKYQQDGFCVLPSILPADLITRTVAHMDAVMRQEYETGKAPFDHSGTGIEPTKLRKIDQPHVADRTILEAITQPELGRLIARIMGAKLVQVWAVQMLYKPPGGAAHGSVGWHQDQFYWKTNWTPDSNVFTAWLALSDVREECGPMHFVPGSQRWGLMNLGDFFAPADEGQRGTIAHALPPGETWREESGAMPAGAFSLHHRLVFHGSQPNLSQIPRYSFAVHLRTEKSTPTPKANPAPGEYDYVSFLDDPAICPVIYEA